MTQQEKETLDHLAQAWNKFIKLPGKHPDHINEFKDAIHKAQYIIGTIIARRIDPNIWYIPEEE